MMLGIEIGRSKSQSLKYWLWKRLWTCRKTDYKMKCSWGLPVLLRHWVVGSWLFERTYRHSWTYAISSYAVSVLSNFIQAKENEIIIFLDMALSFTFREWKRI